MNDLELVLFHKLSTRFTPHERSMLKALAENPENHNGIYRGKDLTNVYTIEQIYERVHDGSFEDLYLGDYFTVHLTTDLMTRFTGAAFVEGTTYYEMDSGTDVTQRTWTVTQDAEPQTGKVYATKQVVEEDVDYLIAGFDLYLQVGRDVYSHHIILIPRTFYSTLSAFCKDTSNRGGYAGSDIHRIVLPCYASSTRAALNNHVIKRPTVLDNSVDDSIPSMCGCGYTGATTSNVLDSVYLQLMNETQYFGTKIMSSSYRDIGYDIEKFPVFNYISPIELYGNIISSTYLRTTAYVSDGVVRAVTLSSRGNVAAAKVNAEASIRPFFLFG